MKIKVEFTVEVDPEDWNMAYGIDKSEVRGYVTGDIKTMVIEHFDRVGTPVAIEGFHA